MALFKVFRGQRNDLDSVTKVDGHAYFCTDDGSFWIDYLDGTEIKRKQVNESEFASLNDKFDDYVEDVVRKTELDAALARIKVLEDALKKFEWLVVD